MKRKNHRKTRDSHKMVASEPLGDRLSIEVREHERHYSEESNKMTSDSVETVPKNVKNFNPIQKSQLFQSKRTTQAQFTKTQILKVQNRLWQAEMNFDYFFKTLKDHPEDKQIVFTPSREMMLQEGEYSFEQDDELPLFSRKKKKDMEWRSRFLGNFAVNEQNRRKSTRIQQIHQKEQLQCQMKQMRGSYYRAKYRYQIPFVRYRLSYLNANCDPIASYECQIITNLPQQPIFSLLSTQKKAMVIRSKLQNLKSRIVAKKSLSKTQ